jgi:(1->4)-alpha-D-glucan 1-alpha-D-glucosylmutase
MKAFAIPRATYRVQFGKRFAFDDAAAIAPYIAELGISHVYASPYLQSRPGSVHGYDITNHNAINVELGGEEGFERMLLAFREHGLQHILDYVPNHMGVGGSDNPLWLDVLEWGSASRYANWFDIDWDSHSEYLRGKLLVPFLADQYGVEVKSGRLELRFDAKEGAFSIWLYDTHKLPVAPPSYAQILKHEVNALKRFAEAFDGLRDDGQLAQRRAAALKAELADGVANDERVRLALECALERFRGRPGELETWGRLDALIRLQYWRPTHFRVAADDINYRRFFNISELAGLRMELPEVFAHTHRLVLRLVKEGRLQGLRIDHIDGLYNPKGYLDQLRASVDSHFYLVVEKILGRHENLRPDWPVQGSTGYEFCAQVTALLVDPAAEEFLTWFYRDFTGESQAFAEIVRESKIKILENELRSELETLSREAERVARQDPYTIDFTQNILRRALKEIIASFPVYRTYVDGSGLHEVDERYIHWAVARAMRNKREVDKSVFEFLQKLLTGKLAQESTGNVQRRSAIRCAMKAQQLSGPVMAKGLEDTAMYRYNRLIALNEVGGTPEQFGFSALAFHKENLRRGEEWPHTMLATSTHDVKHGEDARARLAALSLVPEEWAAKVAAWSRILRARRGDVEGTAPPARNDEYLFFQNLIGTWPAELTLPRPMEAAVLAPYSERLQAAMIKSVREARARSNWISPDEAYENALAEFVRDALNPEIAYTFLENFLPFQQQIAEMGVHNSLVQVLLKVTSPGVPDFYQGSDLWDLNLADPDNRRSVAFNVRQTLLRRLRDTDGGDRCAWFCKLLKNWHDGAIKLAVIQKLLQFRRDTFELFEKGSYEPLQIPETSALRLCGFRRTLRPRTFVAIASLDARLKPCTYPEMSITLGGEGRQTPLPGWRDVLTDTPIRAENGEASAAEVFSVLPIALLVPT